jgi:uncharacterized membrane protein (DUF4010 family)
MEIAPQFTDLAIALGLGLLVGLQREQHRARAGGLRTFALVTAAGCVAALSAPALGLWIVAAGFIGLAMLVAVNHHATARDFDDKGLTTEVTILLMFLVGAYTVVGDRMVAVVLGGTVAVLLQAKGRFAKIMEQMGDQDVKAIMRFALLSLVILPVLPDVDFGPYDALNLQKMWLLVVLIVGISLGGYIGYRLLGQKAGALLGGVLGGVISSTATTVSYARRTRDQKDVSPLAAVVVMIATAIVLIRVMVEIGAVSRPLLIAAAPPLGILLGVAAALSFAIWWRVRKTHAEMPEQENPTQLRPALFFAALYAIVLVAVAWARDRFGQAGLYGVAMLAGLTDVDAITLSTARMAATRQLEVRDAWRVIVVAFISNLVFKAGIVAFIGSRALLWRTAILFGILGAAGGLLIAFYPR